MRTAAKKRRTGSVFVMSCTYLTNILAEITIRFCHRGVSQLALPPGSLERGVIYRQSACLGAHILLAIGRSLEDCVIYRQSACLGAHILLANLQ